MPRRWSVLKTSLLALLAVTACKRVEAPTQGPCPPCQTPAAPTIDITPVVVPSTAGAQVVALDWDGDGKQEVALVGSNGVTVLRLQPDGSHLSPWSSEALGVPTAVAAGDLDQDGRDDLVVGWGRGRERMDAPATLVAYLSKGAQTSGRRPVTIPTPATTRPEFTSLSVTALEGERLGVLFAVFVSKYEVAASFATPGATADAPWQQRAVGRQRMGSHWVAMRFAGDEQPRLLAGRPYGDGQKSFGDVIEWSNEPTARRTVPSVRGVRSLAAVSVGGAAGAAPRTLVCYGAGWHWRYGEQAKGILTCAQPTVAGAWEAQIVDELGGFEVSAIGSADLDGDGARELLARGPDGLHVYTPTFAGEALAETRWERRTIGGGGGRFTVADLDGDGRDELITGGAEPRIYRWSPAGR